MTDQKAETKKTTAESARRFRLTMAALKSVGEASDQEVWGAIREFESFKELYIKARMRELDAREAENPTQGLVSMASALNKALAGAAESVEFKEASAQQQHAGNINQTGVGRKAF